MKTELEELTLTGILQELEDKGYNFDFGKESSEEMLRKVVVVPKRYAAPVTTADAASTMVDLFVREVHRIEGMSDPSDNCIIYALETPKGVKGFLVNAYGI